MSMQPNAETLRIRVPLMENVARIMRDVIDGNTSGVRDLISSITAAPATARAGSVIVVARSDGAWPDLERDPDDPSAWMWVREYGATGRLADMPTSLPSWRPTDLVFPVTAADGGATTPSTLVWSDSLVVATQQQVHGRVGDAYAGGSQPTWATDVAVRWDGHVPRLRLLEQGMELYNDVYAMVDQPRFTAAGRRFSFDLVNAGDRHDAGVVLAGSTYLAQDRVQLRWARTGDVLAWRLLTPSETINLGTSTYVPRRRVTITQDGASVRVQYGDTDVSGTIPGTLPPQLPFTLHSPAWHFAWFQNIVVEGL